MAAINETTPLLKSPTSKQEEVGLAEVVISPATSKPDTSIETDKTAPLENYQRKQNGEKIGTSDLKAFVTILKSSIGTGVLAMPFAVQCAGLWIGTVGIFLLGLLALGCTHMLVKAARFHRERAAEEGQGNGKLTYEQLTTTTLLSFRPGLKEYPRLMNLVSIFVKSLLLLSQLGFCAVYIVFVATNIQQTLEGVSTINVPLVVYQLVVTLLLLLYCQIKDLDTMSPCLAIGNIVTLVCLGIIFANFFSPGIPDVSASPIFASWATIPTFLSTVVFSFEGISMVLPLESEVRNKDKFSSRFGVLTMSMMIVTSLYSAMGFFGFLSYGAATEASITLNLPLHPWIYAVVKPGFALVIFISYNVQLYVPANVVMSWPWLRSKCHLDKKEDTSIKKKMAEPLVRTLLILLTFIVAVACPRLDVMISFVGAFASSFLALILPGTIYLLTTLCRPHHPPHPALIAALVLVIVFGFTVFIIGTYVAVMSMVGG